MWGAFSVHNTQAKQTEMEAMQKYYEDKLAGMQAAIAELTQQRDALAAAVAAAEGNRHSEAGLAAHADLAERLEHTERQLVDMQGRHRDLSRIAEVKAKMGAEGRARAPPPPHGRAVSNGCWQQRRFCLGALGFTCTPVVVIVSRGRPTSVCHVSPKLSYCRGVFFCGQIEELQKSVRELKKTRVQKEKAFEKEKLEFRKELDARLREIEVLKRNSEKVKSRMQVRTAGLYTLVCHSRVFRRAPTCSQLHAPKLRRAPLVIRGSIAATVPHPPSPRKCKRRTKSGATKWSCCVGA